MRAVVVANLLLLLLGCQSTQPLPRVDVHDGRCTRQADTPQTEGPCTLSLLSYNVRGLSPLLIAAETHGDERFRSASLGWMARDYDLVLLQEDFEYHDRITEGPMVAFVQRGSGPHWTLWPLKLLTLPLWPFRFSAPYGSGLTIAAPALEPVAEKKNGMIERVDGVIVRTHLNDCNGWISDASDCFSSKGLLGMRLLLRNGAEIDVYTTHLDAGSSRGDRQARRNQLKRIRKKIEKKSRGRAVIFAGDLNIGYDPAPEPGPAPTNLEAPGEDPNPDYRMLYEELILPLGLSDTGVRPREGRHFGDRVDWILYRGSASGGDRVDIQVRKGGEDERFRHPFNRGSNEKPLYHKGVLSDHPALGVCFVIQRWDAAADEADPNAAAGPPPIDAHPNRKDLRDAPYHCRQARSAHNS